MGSDVNAAYAARASALASAYAQSDKETIRKSAKDAWKKFGAALKLANKNWRSAQKSAWDQFKTAIKACGPGSTSIVDNGEGREEMRIQD